MSTTTTISIGIPTLVVEIVHQPYRLEAGPVVWEVLAGTESPLYLLPGVPIREMGAATGRTTRNIAAARRIGIGPQRTDLGAMRVAIRLPNARRVPVKE